MASSVNAHRRFLNRSLIHRYRQTCLHHMIFTLAPQFTSCLVGWGCRIYRLHRCRGISPTTTGYDSKQPDGEAPVMLELWGMWNTLFLPSVPGPLGPGVVATERVLSMGQMELPKFETVQINDFC